MPAACCLCWHFIFVSPELPQMVDLLLKITTKAKLENVAPELPHNSE
jgi:hypothetical protein